MTYKRNKKSDDDKFNISVGTKLDKTLYNKWMNICEKERRKSSERLRLLIEDFIASLPSSDDKID